MPNTAKIIFIFFPNSDHNINLSTPFCCKEESFIEECEPAQQIEKGSELNISLDMVTSVS